MPKNSIAEHVPASISVQYRSYSYALFSIHWECAICHSFFVLSRQKIQDASVLVYNKSSTYIVYVGEVYEHGGLLVIQLQKYLICNSSWVIKMNFGQIDGKNMRYLTNHNSSIIMGLSVFLSPNIGKYIGTEIKFTDITNAYSNRSRNCGIFFSTSNMKMEEAK